MTMKKPEMETVRFVGSDVIVASAIPSSVTFAHFADAEGNNGTVTYNGKTYGYTTQQNNISNSIFANPDYSSYGVQSVNGWIPFNELISVERTSGWGHDNGVVDGTYTWDPDQNKYHQ